MSRSHVLGKFPLEFRNPWPLAHPTAFKHRQNRLLFSRAEGGSGDGNVSRTGNGAHDTSTTAGAFALFLHRINSRNPCSKETAARNPSIVSAFSTAARRLCTFPTRRASRCCGRSDESVICNSILQRSFRLVCTPVPILKTS